MSGSHAARPGPRIAGTGQDEPAVPGVHPPRAEAVGEDQAPDHGGERAGAPTVLAAADDEAV
ncbi:hypothetical protein GCM10018785_09040 [Streptomyces longispororuber]|uniref:Uncharacterized protein n=1 Tax=Streptomyces longispororuber TaxID=68230 RepID=A0A918Z9S0_9ACTN|nr:hypothetical protein [Streptomyces longispororuber]GHE41578.1 hypothetical protein GCM10018785_09040 [Streptomyces longispororuber]